MTDKMAPRDKGRGPAQVAYGRAHALKVVSRGDGRHD
jgi:hypothetical protein